MMSQERPVALEYENLQPPPVRRLAAPAFVCWLGLVTTVVGVIILLQSPQPEPDDRQQARFGAIVACFGVTWWILGLILRQTMRR